MDNVKINNHGNALTVYYKYLMSRSYS
jgi:hypothetical protein